MRTPSTRSIDWAALSTIAPDDTRKRWLVALLALLGIAAGFGLKSVLASHFPWAAHLDSITWYSHGRHRHHRQTLLELVVCLPCLLLGAFLGALLAEWLQTRDAS